MSAPMEPLALPAPLRATDPLRDELAPLLSAAARPAGTPAAATRARLLHRIHRAADAARLLETHRLAGQAMHPVSPGVHVRVLHAAAPGAPRPGEPRRAWTVELAAGARWSPPPGGDGCQEWLVLRGQAVVDGETLFERSHRLAGPDAPGSLHSPTGALLMFRESADPAGTALAGVQHDQAAAWQPFAPGIWRRLLYRDGGAASMLYHALPGAQVPGHLHDHDEECLMLAGELFADDVLLRRGDYQLAPAGTRHGGVMTDTGALIYAHGDADLHLLMG
ncbi:MAG: cupin domain-containing protein [Rubrivivax sp.]|nr:cupin domain-containing protein [Rubrivivax sp.]